MVDIIKIVNNRKYERKIAQLTNENNRLRFALKVLVRNFSGFCCLCDHDPEKNEEPCPIRRNGTLLDCVAWLVDGANRQRETWDGMD